MLKKHPLKRTILAVLTLSAFALSSAGFSPTGGSSATAGQSGVANLGSKFVPVKQARKPRAKPRLVLSKRHVTLGESVRLAGRALPGGRRKVKILVRGPEKTVLRDLTGHTGRYGRHWRPDRPGVYRLRALVGANGRARGGAGTPRTVVVYRPAHASWYGPGFYGNRTACGQTLSEGMLGVAHKTLPCGTKLKLRLGKRSVTVRVIDRGPFIPGREFDLTYATKLKLGFGDVGTVYASR